GDMLAKELVQEFKTALPLLQNPRASSLPLPQLSTIIASEQRDRFEDFLTKRYTVASFDPAYSALRGVRVRRIVTTNIDDLVFKVYDASPSHYLNDVTLRGLTLGDKEAVEYVPL